MDHITRTAPATGSVWAVLVGGPASIPQTSRDQMVGPQDQKIKLPHHGGYEHFERAADAVDGPPDRQIVFTWTMRTEIAE
ncbi:DUF5988 family protein [Actinomadura verrucosospora]|uniref:Uncharacterized protein n=1 Tax=Actinomadura verrucosospora TaxID=46165 RepID=A0A7D3ZUQ2_ACTVE|nr:DUF5988 family protein [Actinomadura verrucosospora]QKG19166.1 hypothetical protein ACTIVE_0802 [Actinomadura verrucosospora]